jgi:hypothetical protein
MRENDRMRQGKKAPPWAASRHPEAPNASTSHVFPGQIHFDVGLSHVKFGLSQEFSTQIQHRTGKKGFP